MDAEQERAFTAFVGARSGHLLHAAHLLTGDRQRAEDLLQTALTRAYLRWDKIASEDPEGYVRRILANAHIDWWRRKPWREEPADQLPETPQTRYDDPSSGVVVRDAVLRALAGLSARQRAVVVLRYYEDLSEAEIATVLDCSPGTVKSAASRALAHLRAHPALAREEHPS